MALLEVEVEVAFASLAIREEVLQAPPLAAEPPVVPEPIFPEILYDGHVTYCKTEPEMHAFLQEAYRRGATVFGLDLEWTVKNAKGYFLAGPQRKTALLQLGYYVGSPLDNLEAPAADRDLPRPAPDSAFKPCMDKRLEDCSNFCVGLFHLAALRTGGEGDTWDLPPIVKDFLLDPKMIKAGLNINGDAKKLSRDFGVAVASTTELSDMAKDRCLTGGPRGRIMWSLKNLSARLLGAVPSKESDVRCSLWDRVPLNNDQIKYSANDAYVSLVLYEVLRAMPVPEGAAAAPAPAAAPRRTPAPRLRNKAQGAAGGGRAARGKGQEALRVQEEGVVVGAGAGSGGP